MVTKLDGLNDSEKNDGTHRQFISAIIVNLLAFSYGSNVGWMAPVTQQLTSDDSPIGIRVTDDELSWMSSIAFLGGMVGTLLWGRIADYFGRKVAGYGVGVSLVLGWAVVLFTSQVWALYAGRFILGFSSGSFVVGPLYVAETATDSLRGTLGSFIILFMNLGVLFSYGMGAILSYRMLTVACGVVPIVFIILYIFLPETPAYFWSKNKREEAEKSFSWLRCSNDKLVREEMIKLETTMQKQEMAGLTALFENSASRKSTLIGLALFFFQQFSGIFVILNYATVILTKSKSSVSPALATTLVGVFQLISSICSSLITDKIGRKTLIGISYVCVTLSLVVMGLCFIYSFPKWMPFACLSFYVLTYPLGAGPLTFVILSEILAPKIRGIAMSTFVVWGTINVFLTLKIYPWLVEGLEYSGMFWFFGACSLLAVLFIIFVIPETKGVPLVEVLAKLNGQSYVDRV